jgi:hypothetical protein
MMSRIDPIPMLKLDYKQRVVAKTSTQVGRVRFGLIPRLP